MRKQLKNEIGITLVALVITIVILLILAEITLAIFNGNNGLLVRAKETKEKNNEASARELVIRKLYEFQIYEIEENKSNSLEDLEEYLKEDKEVEYTHLYIQKETLVEIDNGEKATHAKIKLKDYQYVYTINKELNIVQIDGKEMENAVQINNKKIIDIDAQNGIEKGYNVNKVKDLIANVKLNCYNITLSDNNDSLYFSGNANSYCEVLKDDFEIQFPCTVTFAIKPEELEKYEIVYSDGKNGIMFAITNENSHLICSANKSEAYQKPDDFYDGNIKYISITYNGDSTEHQLYINGQKMEKISYKGYFNLSSDKMLFGLRYYNEYKDSYKGNLYDFKIYNKILTQEEINNIYIQDKNYIENNNEKQIENKNDMQLEYIVKQSDSLEKEEYIKQVCDKTENKNNLLLSNIEYSYDEKALFFNESTNSYGYMKNENVDFSYPFTISFAIKPEENDEYDFVYSDGKSGVIFGIANKTSRIYCSSQSSEVYDKPNDFYDGKIKYITVTYNKDSTQHQLYIDGKKIEKSDYKGYFNLTSTKTFFGLRYNEEYKNPYKGYLYNFKVYSGILTDEQIKKLYQDEKIE